MSFPALASRIPRANPGNLCELQDRGGSRYAAPYRLFLKQQPQRSLHFTSSVLQSPRRYLASLRVKAESSQCLRRLPPSALPPHITPCCSL